MNLILPYSPGDLRPTDAELRVSPLRATYFLCKQKVTKELFRGENTDSTSGAKGAALAHSIFPLKTPVFYGGAFIKCSVLLTGAG